LRPLHNVVSEGKARQKNGELTESVCSSLWYSAPFFMGITGVNEHIEPVCIAVLPSAVIIPSR